ncbi:MAG: tetratricopeptide repeat protein [Polyangiaceae bacterium]|nr:tetratricopeptide repeat protein [Polyangiaceae bacterium]
MSIELIRGELERLFSLEEMLALSNDLLGLDPKEVGGAASKASFARALTDKCVEMDAAPALLDALLVTRADVIDPKLRELLNTGVTHAEELKPGDTFAGFTIGKKLGEGPRGAVYTANKGGSEYVLKVMKRSGGAGRGAFRRLMTHVRLAQKVHHDNLAANLQAGIENGRGWVAYSPVEGQPLAARIARTGPLHINEAKTLLRGVLQGLAALHEQRIAHGGVKLENVIVARGSDGTSRAVLVDFGGDRVGFGGFPWGVPAALKAASPEQVRGQAGDRSSDLYAFGSLLFEVLTGKPVVSGDSGVDVSIAILSQPAPAPSSLAPRGWVTKELDDLVAKLLAKTASARPKDVAAVLDAIDAIGKSKDSGKKKISDEDLNDRVDLLIADPGDSSNAMALESSIDEGADPKRVGEALQLAADGVDEGESEGEKIKSTEIKKQLLFRAARVFEHNAKDLGSVEQAYTAILALDPEDEVALQGLEDARRAQGKHEELIEMLLERSQKHESHTERARALNQIGHLYWKELEDREQATFAFAQALAQDAKNHEYASDLERAAGSDMKLWAEALQILSEVTTHPNMPAEAKIALFTLLGSWYSEKIARPDMGLPCFQAVLSVDPAHDGALEGVAQVYRRAQQWSELAQVLLSRADRAPTPSQARDLRAEAADLYGAKLNDATRQLDLYEQIFKEDPGHKKAGEALVQIYRGKEDWSGLAKILEKEADALQGERKVDTICKIAELYEDQLDDLVEATRRYEAALELDPMSLTALKGLDRIYNRTGRYKELLDNLEKQIHIAATPRQRINLYERMAGIHEEEFLDHAKAAETREAILSIDAAHENSLTGLVRHYRVLGRWEDVVGMYERHLGIVTEEKKRVDLLLAMGRVLVDQVGSPERASKVYEKVLEIDPNHGGALEALAHVRAASGDAMAALAAVESLAERATNPETKADRWLQAANILEHRGDRDGAIERYKKALDAQPTNVVATTNLRSAYLARGDATSAVELISKTIDVTDGNLAKARLYGEMAQMLRDKLRDNDRAEKAATKAVDLDPTNINGLWISGDLAFENGRFIEASKNYASLANRVDVLPKEEQPKLLMRYVDALSNSGSTEKAAGVVEKLLALAPDDSEAIVRAAKVSFDSNKGKDAARLYQDLLKRFGEKLTMNERADAMLKLGESWMKAGEFEEAILPLTEAADMLPDSAAPINALCKVYEAKKDWEEVVRLKTRRLDVVVGDERAALLLEIGDVLANQINDRTRAAKSYVAALDERPDDRKTLTKLMQLYSEEKDWAKLIEVVLKLAAKVDDPKQKVKYLHTAAIVSAKQLSDYEQAAKFYDEVLTLDPTFDKARAELMEIRELRGDHEGLERALKLELEKVSETGDTAKMLQLFDRLGALYKDKLGKIGEAVDAYEAAQSIDPDNEARNNLLAEIYLSNQEQFNEKALATLIGNVHKNPYKPDTYRSLRRYYTENKRADAAFCMCQALYCMNAAEPDEERFFKRMRPEGAAAATDRMGDDDWGRMLMHSDSDPLLTEIMAIIEPAVLRKNGQPFEALGYNVAFKLDLSRHPYPMSQTLFYAAGILGMEPPITFQNPNDPSGVAFLHAYQPAIVLGASALVLDLPTQAAAFIAARHLTYYRPGLYLRHLVATGTALRAWLFAAIRMIVPQFPVSAELEGPVRENLNVLEGMVTGQTRDRLASAVTKLLQAGAIDLKRWVAGVDLTADRAGFVACNDLELASEMIKAADEGSSAVPQKDRLRELVLYSTSEEYFALRRRLGINIDA